jgi:hypothetical protein
MVNKAIISLRDQRNETSQKSRHSQEGKAKRLFSSVHSAFSSNVLLLLSCWVPPPLSSSSRASAGNSY